MYVTTNSSNLKNDLSGLFDIVCLRHNHILKVKVCIWYLLKCREKSLHEKIEVAIWVSPVVTFNAEGHLQPSLRAGGLEFLIAELHRSPSCSLVVCNVIAENSAPTLEGRGVSTRSCLDHLHWLNTVLVHCITSSPL